MRIDQIGEFGLIDRIERGLPVPGKDVIVGIGDDVAVLQAASERVWLATCDVQMEGAHFLRAAVDPRELGRKALAINLSDIAAAGGTPRFALVSLGLPDDLPVEFVDELYAGLRSEAAEFSVDIVGGNISRSRLGLFVDIFVLGEAPRENVMLRSGAQPGDAILVTGTVGDAAAGVALETNPAASTTPDYRKHALSRLCLPTPRVDAGRAVGAAHMATAMLDISDGLAGDLGHILDKSGVGARLVAERLPVAVENREMAKAVFGDEWHFALHGGEDYELLLTVPAAKASALAGVITQQGRVPVAIIGEILPSGAGRQLELPGGRQVPLAARGWDHFNKGE